MNDSNECEAKHERNRRQRHAFIKRWAEYVRTHPDEQWGKQVNTLIDPQIESARHFEDIRPDLDQRRDSSSSAMDSDAEDSGPEK